MQTITIKYPLTQNDIQSYAKPQVVAIGQFDGLHLGHEAVIKSAVALAHQKELPVSVMTFYPHPKEVMKKGDYDGYLTPPKEKEELLRSMGVDYLYIIEFNEAFSQVSPQCFVYDMLLPLQIDTAVVGFDFRFGYRGEGHADMLRKLGAGKMEVETVPAFLLEGEKVSSSGIRKWLKEGKVDLAAVWLGRPYVLRGSVVDGEKRGRLIGFPTANVELSEHFVLPANGVYAVLASTGETWLPGVMNIGVKPTFHSGELKPKVEVHLLDFSGDLYTQELTVQLIDFLREERKFGSVDELIAQIGRDAETARLKLQ
ncbi:bifunctional riboflavin kinase/FAD synthetase [Paenibacillus sp. CAA11]|uniref:bifunctional riboflavin kinase/FAD synthetase n=1 Tax=Paenibacillus sp. CAA11 TaxID=1532905 RepID=UPI000D3B4D4D|nr:bifunctional riboflavin kinase/FAD synthetase [Paenibacillus sp. CAA11]AWB44345.1 bifunctional riboflavin kinase/FAD synthetase [Paenibacillus sp. CAA11]